MKRTLWLCLALASCGSDDAPPAERDPHCEVDAASGLCELGILDSDLEFTCYDGGPAQKLYGTREDCVIISPRGETDVNWCCGKDARAWCCALPQGERPDPWCGSYNGCDDEYGPP